MASTEGTGPAKSSLPWLWVIEYLASSEHVNLQLLHGIIEGAPLLHDELGKNVRESICLRCLEQLCGSANENATTSGVSLELDRSSMFELSRSCEDVLADILREGSVSDFRAAGREPLKSQVRRFIVQKKTSVPKPALQQLKDAIVEGAHPAASLKVSSGLVCLSDGHRVSVENVEHNDIHPREPDERRDDDPKMGPNGNSNSAERGRFEQQSGGDSSSRYSPPSKRNLHVLDAENFPQNSDKNQHSDDDFTVHSPVAKKLKHAVPAAVRSETAPSVLVVESDSERYIDAEQDIAQDPMETDEDRAMKDGPEIYDEQRIISDRVQSEPRVALPESTPKGDPGTSQEPIDGVTEGEFQQSEIIIEDTMDIMDQQHIEELSSDSDGYQNEEINLSMRKNEFLVSQRTSTSCCLVSPEVIEQKSCMKCNEGGKLLVCHTSTCSVVIHEKCVDLLTKFDENRNFFCPFCQYSNAIAEYVEAKKEVISARKDLGGYFCNMFVENSIYELAGVSTDHDCSQEEREHQKKGRQNGCANIASDRRWPSEECAEEQPQSNLNGVLGNKVSGHHMQRDEGQPDNSNSDLNASSPIEEEEDVSNEDATAVGAEEDGKKNRPQTIPSRGFELETIGRMTLDAEENQVNGKVQECRQESEVMAEDQGNGRNVAANPSLDGRSDEVRDQQEPLQNVTNESLHATGRALDTGGTDNSEDDIEDTDGDDESIVAKYSISFRRRTNRRVSSSPVVQCQRQKKAPWSEEEIKILKEGVEKFTDPDNKTIAWKNILELGGSVLMQGRTAQDLKNKWSSISRRSPKKKR